jgi:hypothetical protein
MRMAKGVYRVQEARPGAPRHALRREWLVVDGETAAQHPSSFSRRRVARPAGEGHSPHHDNGAGPRTERGATRPSAR